MGVSMRLWVLVTSVAWLLIVAEKNNFYDILAVAKDATPDHIKKAFKKKALEWHPDKNKDPQATERFREVAAAFEVLSSPEQRKLYDGGGADVDFKFDFGDFKFTDPDEIFKDFFGGGDPWKMFDKVFDQMEKDVKKEPYAGATLLEVPPSGGLGGFFSSVSSFFGFSSSGSTSGNGVLPDGSVHRTTGSSEVGGSASKDSADASKATGDAEEKARKETEDKVRKEAEAAEQVRTEAAAKARKEAEEKARQEADNKLRKEAEAADTIRKEAAANARKEAEDGARKEAEEKARKEAEEKAPIDTCKAGETGDSCQHGMAVDPCLHADKAQDGYEPHDDSTDKHVGGSACCNDAPQPEPTDKGGCCKRCASNSECDVFVFQPSAGTCWLMKWKPDAVGKRSPAQDRVMGVMKDLR